MPFTSESVKKLWSNPLYKNAQIEAHKGKPSPLKGTIRIKRNRIKHSCGYWLIWVGNHPYANNDGRVPEHRLVMEKKLGRYLNPKVESVHHKDKNKQNNNLENLQLVSVNEHKRFDLGWIKKENKWFKICKDCARELEVCSDNFYLRKSGDFEFLHVCKQCSKKRAINYWKRMNQ